MANYLIKSAKISFLAGVAMLIVRANSYPWPVKRASDLLFLMALIAATSFIFLKKDFGFLRKPLTKKVLWGLVLIFAGLVVAALSGYIVDGIKLTPAGVLEVGRFVEVATILLLVGFFEHASPGFYKKIAVAQLSTLIYLGVFVVPNSLHIQMYRFQLFENWPSNVGYYLVISLSFLFAALLFRKRGLTTTLPYFIAAAGLAGIFLWAQSRAAWLGALAAFIIIIFSRARKSFGKIAAGFATAGTIVVLGALILPPNIQNTVLGRFFPGAYKQIDPIGTAPTETIKIILERGGVDLRDGRRVELWKAYSEKILEAPLGLGPSYDPNNIVGAPQGPHNTVLEYLVLGGLIGLAGAIYLFWLGFKNAWNAIKAFGEKEKMWLVYVFASLLGLVVASMFDNMSTFRLMWVMLGIAVFAQQPSTDTATHVIAGREASPA